MDNEIISAEIYLQPVDTSSATADIDEELKKVEDALKSYTSTATMLDYSVAVISGILAGAIDALYVKETPLFQERMIPSRDQVMDIINKLIDQDPAKKAPLKRAVYKPAAEGIAALLPIPDTLKNSPTPLGLALSILVQAGQGGMLWEKDKQLHFLPENISNGEGVILAAAAGIVGVLKWLTAISKEHPDADETPLPFKTLVKICGLINAVPAFSQIVSEIEKWQKRLPNEIKVIRKKNDSNLGIEQVFCSFFMMLGSIPALEHTNLRAVTDRFLEAKRLGFDEMPVFKMLNRQAFPVLINEIIVRSMFFATRLAKELSKTEDVSRIDWQTVLPFGNRTIDRLIAISSMTLSVADTADAAIHAALDSCGDMILFAKSFVTRFNFVAASRAAVAVVREISNERAEEELLRTKRLLTEARTAKALEILQDYQQQLEKRVCEYLAEDITAFLEGIDTMDRGLLGNDSDLVIKGNVTIQRVLGREAQFTSQQEFDDLMDSDTAFKL